MIIDISEFSESSLASLILALYENAKASEYMKKNYGNNLRDFSLEDVEKMLDPDNDRAIHDYYFLLVVRELKFTNNTIDTTDYDRKFHTGKNVKSAEDIVNEQKELAYCAPRFR